MLKEIGFLINKNNIFLLNEILKDKEELWIEIGSGNGEYIVNLAKKEEKNFFIAIEIKFKRVYKTIKKLKKANLDNLLVIHGNAEIFVEFFLNNNSITNFIINFPDPWFKKRHKKRRLINKAFYQILYNKLTQNGHIYIATDYREYAEIILQEAKETNLFAAPQFTQKWLYSDVFTKYELSYLNQGKKIFYLVLTKANQ